jgi:hypothetical protein
MAATPTGSSYRWLPSSDIASDPQVAGGQREAMRHLVDAETMTEPTSIDNIVPYVPQPVTRPVLPIARILPTFRDITNPAMLQAIIQPNKIYSVDVKKRTAVVSYPASLEKSTMAWADLLQLNPEMLAAFLVHNAP